ncbi:hypothetical protein T08_14105, partial [Trichinella sp. T8]
MGPASGGEWCRVLASNCGLIFVRNRFVQSFGSACFFFGFLDFQLFAVFGVSYMVLTVPQRSDLLWFLHKWRRVCGFLPGLCVGVVGFSLQIFTVRPKSSVRCAVALCSREWSWWSGGSMQGAYVRVKKFRNILQVPSSATLQSNLLNFLGKCNPHAFSEPSLLGHQLERAPITKAPTVQF